MKLYIKAGKNNIQNFGKILIFTVFLCLFILLSAPEAASRSYRLNQSYICSKNLSTIEGALELYIMENKKSVSSVDELVKNGYLKTAPICRREKNSYIFSQPIDDSNIKNFYKIVKCNYHGFFFKDENLFETDIDLKNQYIRDRKMFFVLTALVILFFTGWQFAVLKRKKI